MTARTTFPEATRPSTSSTAGRSKPFRPNRQPHRQTMVTNLAALPVVRPARVPAISTRPLFDFWKQISRRLKAARDVRLFLDFDGTIVDFRDRPDQVTLDGKMRTALQRVAAHPLVHVAIVSGRRRASLLQYVNVPRVQFFGLYGWERADGLHPAHVALDKISEARVVLSELPNEVPGIYIEDKEVSLAVHFREVSPEAQRRAHAWLRREIGRFREDLRITRASNVWEVVPRGIRGKGLAVRELLRGVRGPFLPIYVGDDLTDEPPFSVLRAGITVLVGPLRRTKARYHLQNTTEVRLFLQRLEAALP
jgi:trehalose-phosphatase